MLKKLSVLILASLVGLTSALAQYDGDDVYDPFADYSEFEEDSQEEADINFFRNGRFFNIGLLLGGRMFTGGMAQHVEASPSPGLALTYFFNIRLALQFAYTYSQHLLGPIDDPANVSTIEGNVGMTSLSFDLKYYFNTSNVTRGLADLNPYILAGFSQNTRAFSLVDQTIVAKDEGGGIDLGVGVEIPVARNEMFVGAQFTYTYVNFATENQPWTQNPNVYLDGDVMQLYFLLGFNFL